MLVRIPHDVGHFDWHIKRVVLQLCWVVCGVAEADACKLPDSSQARAWHSMAWQGQGIGELGEGPG